MSQQNIADGGKKVKALTCCAGDGDNTAVPVSEYSPAPST